MISKEIRYENTIHDVILELDRSCLTMKWYTVSFLDPVAKETVLILKQLPYLKVNLIQERRSILNMEGQG